MLATSASLAAVTKTTDEPPTSTNPLGTLVFNRNPSLSGSGGVIAFESNVDANSEPESDQGNGEICITALETSLHGTLQFVVRKGMKLRWPRAETPTHYMVMGLDRDLTKAMKIAAREAVAFLTTEKGLSASDAYMLASMTVDICVTQVVDGTLGVHGMIPKAIFKKK